MENINIQKCENAIRYWEKTAISDGSFSGFKIYDIELGKYRLSKEINTLKTIIENKNTEHSEKMQILDIGCACGHFTDFFSYYGSVVGIDFSHNYVEYCLKRFINNKNISIYNADILNFSSQSKFDIIFIGGVLEYLMEDDIEIALNNVKNLLAKDGIAIFRESTVSKKQITTLEGDEKMPCFRRTLNYYQEKISKQGFRIKDIIPNYACTYTTMISKYKKILHLNTDIFDNPIIEHVLLYLPLIIIKKIKTNMFTYHFIVTEKI